MNAQSPLVGAPAALQSPPADTGVAGMPGFFHRYADVNGTRIHYVAGGSGPAVVLVHGWPYTWATWRKLMPLLAKAGFTAIAPDLRGIGDSAAADEGFSKINVAEDIRQIVKSLGFEQINLLGSDIGTHGCLRLCRRPRAGGASSGAHGICATGFRP